VKDGDSREACIVHGTTRAIIVGVAAVISATANNRSGWPA